MIPPSFFSSSSLSSSPFLTIPHFFHSPTSNHRTMNRYFISIVLVTFVTLISNGTPGVLGQSCYVNTTTCGWNTPNSNCCTICLQEDACMWCETEGKCTEGDYFGPNNQVTCSKSHAFFGTCKRK
jgi:hypothetical protein